MDLLAFALAVEWVAYGGDAGGTRYSAAKQVNVENVAGLREAWTISTGDLYNGGRGRPSVLETTPLYAGGVLYLTSAWGRVMAADPETGAVKWTYDPKVKVDSGWGDFTNRGVAIHRSKGRTTVVGVTIDARLFTLDARNGKLLWEVDLRKGLRIEPGANEFADYEQTSPPCVLGDVIVVGSAVADNGRTRMPSGEVRGFDVATGKMLWKWDPAAGTEVGGANAWSVIVGDAKRGVVYVPTGSPSPDYYGGMRKEFNYGNSLVALEARTGRMLWSFQTVRHDLWDYDVAPPPVLLKVKGRDAVAVGSKSGHLFVLDRDTGKPLLPVEERTVPASDVEGEQASAKQPVPVLPKPFGVQTFKLWGSNAEMRKWCEERVAGLRNEGVFTPPAVRGTLIMPGNIGGLHWGGMTYDQEQQLIIAPSNNLPAVVRLIPRAEYDGVRRGDRLGLEFAAQAGTPFGMARTLLISPEVTPCNEPPWGQLTAVDANTGEQRWQVPLGEFAGQKGSPNLGGPISTAGGVTFIGATFDGYFRAFETKSGRELWKAKLPASARSTPMTYVHKGKQYVVIAAGGHDARIGPPSDKVVAYRLAEAK